MVVLKAVQFSRLTKTLAPLAPYVTVSVGLYLFRNAWAALIGYHVAGLAGAAVAITAMCGPTCLLAFLVARTWDRFKDAHWRIAIQAGLVPLSLGLIGASAFVLARTADTNVYAGLLTAVTAIVAFATRINPLWLFGAGGLMGLLGLF